MAKPGPDPIGKEECRKGLEKAVQRLGHSPSIREYRSLGISPNASTIKRHFGGWNAAKEAVGLDTNPDSYDINDSYFDSIDSPRKAYWVGLFWADGHLDADGRFNLTSIDTGHLEQLLGDMGAEHHVYYHDDTPRITIRNQSLVRAFERLGATIDKNGTGTLPPFDGWAWPHFTRGLFDGDGHAKNNPNRSLIIVQNRNRLEQLRYYTPVEGTIHDGNGTHRIGWWGEDFEEMVAWMYPDGGDTEPALARKRDPILEWA
jgi:hypothetical protein